MSSYVPSPPLIYGDEQASSGQFNSNAKIYGSLQVIGVSEFDNSVLLTLTVDSTSPTTGSLVISGGLAVAKSLFVGSTTASTSTTSGALVVSGGLGVVGDIYSGTVTAGTVTTGNSTVTNSSSTSMTTGSLLVTISERNTSTIPSTSATTGALVISGGLGVAGDIYSGTVTTGNSSVTSMTAGSLLVTLSERITSTIPSTGATTGALIVSGGLGSMGSVCIGPGAGLRVSEVANGKQGIVTLVGGAVSVANSNVTPISRIFLSTNVVSGTAGFLVVSSRVSGTSFSILSSSATDSSVVAYEIFEPSF